MQGFSPSRNTPQAAAIYNHLRDTRSDPAEKFIRDAACKARTGRTPGSYSGITIHFIGREDLIANKHALGRKKDLADLEALGEG